MTTYYPICVYASLCYPVGYKEWGDRTGVRQVCLHLTSMCICTCHINVTVIRVLVHVYMACTTCIRTYVGTRVYTYVYVMY